MNLAPYSRILRRVIKKPPMTSIAGLVALVLACSYIYLLSAQVSGGTAEPVASSAVSARQHGATSSPEANAGLTPTATETRTPTPARPTASPTATPTYTPISYTPTPAHVLYVVQPGDTLGGIARRFNTTAQAIMELNNLSSDLIDVGQELLIPGTRQISTPMPASTATNTRASSASSPIPTADISATTTSAPPAGTPQPTTALPGALPSDEPQVVAFYYAWYGLDEWTPSRVPDIPAVPYESRDRNTLIMHVEQVQGAGGEARHRAGRAGLG